MKTPLERAAQLWCLPQFEKREMDGDFCRAIAEAICIAVNDEQDRCAKIAEYFWQQKNDPLLPKSDPGTAYLISTNIRALRRSVKDLD